VVINRSVARNIIWNWAGLGTGMLVGFLIAPFLIHRLGENLYGLWILIASFTNYFGLLDLGIRASVGRNIAYHRAQGDAEGVRATLNTSLVLLCGMGLVALLATFALVPLFPQLFDIPAGQLSEVRLALLLVGLNLALWLPLNVFDAALWGYQRFDLLNAVDIPAVLLRAGLTFYLIGAGHGLVVLALINLLFLAGGQAVKAIICFRLDPALRLSPRAVSRGAARRVLGYGVWYFLFAVTRMVTNQMSPIIIGLLLGVGLVALYSIASRLMSYANSLLGSCTGVLTPVATALHAEDKTEQQRRLFLTGGKYCLALALFVLTVCLFLGKPLVTLWVGSGMEAAAGLLLVLALGEVLPMSQLTTQSMLLGMGRHKITACLGVVENILGIGAAVALAPAYGLLGVCLAFAVSGALCRGVGLAVCGCRLMQVPLGTYVTRVLLPPVLWALPSALLLAVLVAWRAPASWLELALYLCVYGLAYVCSCGLLVTDGRLWGRGVKVVRGFLGTR
jgi:O-antigen/teichoic acid export membrane protein